MRCKKKRKREFNNKHTFDLLKLIITIFFLLVLFTQSYALTPDQVFNKVKDSVVVVKTLDAKGEMQGMGSGVILPSGKIATNCHVVEGGIYYQVGRKNKFVHATLYAGDDDKDICILSANGLSGKPAQIGKATSLKVGVPVYAVGAPQGLELSLSNGIVAQLRGGPPPLIQTTAAISPGSSGGGLFDVDGRLVGLTTLYVAGGQSLNFAMPVEWIGEIRLGRKMTPPNDKFFISPTLGARFALIPTGTYIMGSADNDPEREVSEVQRQITISQSFYMQTTEVTQGQWRRVMGNNPSYFKSCGDGCPVEQVSWNDVQEFIIRLNQQEKTYKYRLPTDAEWEYAARAGTTTRFHSGDYPSDLSNAGWYSSNSGSSTRPVGQKVPNSWGLFDMHGNVYEWVQNIISDSDYMIRGGCWGGDAHSCRSAYRVVLVSSDIRLNSLGFRLFRMR